MNDPAKRASKLSRLLIVLVISLVIYLLLDGFDLSTPEKLFSDLPDEERIGRMQLILSILFWPLIPMGLYIGYFGIRILRTGQFPPPGSKTIRPVELTRGKPAYVRGGVAILTGLLVCGLAIYGAVIIPRELEWLLH